ncbi:alpha/beta hydrolase [Sphingomonas sp. CL5.1]|uniref:alpha/beta fold hydrolase n=1 Tax=Sphingomonas sp. CL5.1 TaxID=2653203 RepID=UPI0015842C15|nr:alpha/beta hydrolase [Sphingomonas sp. CL5.1]QKS00628.1 alpha/beta hydrolase [Sphingomonas sp. CL5.1]
MTEIRVVTSSGLAIAADVEGQGDVTVILGHGGGQTRNAWRRLSAFLAERGYRVIRYDLRGHGESDYAPDGDYHLPALACDLAAIVSWADSPVALVGASLGGLAAFYALGSGIISSAMSLALVDIVLRPAAEGTARVRTFLDAHLEGFDTVEAAAEAVAAYNAGQARPPSIAGLRRNLRMAEDGRWRWHWDPRFLRQADSIEERGELLMSVASRVAVPVRLLRGGASEMASDAAIAEMAASIPDFSVEIVAGAGHMVSGMANDRYAPAVIAFLEQTTRLVAKKNPDRF